MAAASLRLEPIQEVVMFRGTVIALVATGLVFAGCADEGSVSTAIDQQTADVAIAAAEQSLRDRGFAVADQVDDDLGFESEGCREFDDALPRGDQALPGETASAQSSDFERGDLAPNRGVQERVAALAWFVEDANELDRILARLDDERLKGCIRDEFRSGFAEGAKEGAVELGSVKVEELASPGLGDNSGGVKLIGEFFSSGVMIPFSFALQYVRIGRALVGVFTIAFGPDEPTADRPALLEALVAAVNDQAT